MGTLHTDGPIQRQVECPAIDMGDTIPGPQTGHVRPKGSSQACI